ncbi:mitochondrial substrate carrier family protein [Tieghemostelium lacteum]|uniref:Mitochondrial substrate carrier family protein n=1 Tax=Tieghemostelium lacteum TaxID=361077 RepID=A0A152A1U6_TIELA|nr:mitochondrial substrate carrier family protein [Tieghemostelium lacteum]|eukprot:KYR00169.1 mitochondrial substrate carrier family protein [Tieghemostelium lacteum]
MSDQRNHPLISFFSGGIAGVTAKSAVAPLERVKILFQIKSELYSLDSVYSSIKKIINKEGFKGLWRGNTATITRVFPYAAVQFLSYETIKKNIINNNTPLNNFIAGSSAGGIAVLCTYPLDLLRARLAIEVQDQYTRIHHLFRDTIAKDGFKGAYRGIQPTLIGILPYGGISFSTFEYLKKYAPYNCKDEKGQLIPSYKLMAGGIAGGLAQTASYPFDVVRRRMQTHGFGDGKVEINLEHNSFKTIYNILRNEGIGALYKGLSINYVKVIPTTSIAFYTYELCSGILKGL